MKNPLDTSTKLLYIKIMTQASFYVQAEMKANSLRTASFGGEEHLVVPVVALVEGVLHSANAENPELALAEEFGRYPTAWDGRPLVMNHPRVEDAYVSANSPTVLEDWSFGQLFNTRLSEGKLKTEAWINLTRVAALGGEVESTVARIQAGEVVEVSTGLFASVEDSPGDFNGINYAGVWRSVAPDHLAFLSEGTIGACSVADGCGVPRLNMLRNVPIPSSQGCGCGCDGTGKSGDTPMEPTDEQRLSKANAVLDGLLANSFPADMPHENVQQLLTDALNTVLCDESQHNGLYRIFTFTQDMVVYEDWNSSNQYQRSFIITDNSVTLGDEVMEVNLMTAIVPKANSEPAAGSEEESAPDDAPTVSSEGEETMSNDPNAVVETDDAPETTATDTPAIDPAMDAVVTEPNANAATTVEDYIAAAPDGMKDVLANSLKLHNAARSKLIGDIKANDANVFSDAVLESMDMDTLEATHALAASSAPVDYSGQAGGPRAQAAGGGADASTVGVPKMLEAFPAKTAATA